MNKEINYENKTVFIAGGTSGINLGIARGFAQAGAKVAVMSRSEEKVEAAVALLKKDGSDAFGSAADVRDVDAVSNALTKTHESCGEIDVLISGAAGNFPALAHNLSPNGFKAVVDIDLLGSFNVLKIGFQFLSKSGASVINISAPQAINPMQGQIHVCAAKAGVDMLTRVLAMEWGELGIRVNSIIPGPIDKTEGMRRLAPTANARRAVTSSVPLGRMGTVEDIAQAALWLASPLASYINGAVIPVDGGWSLGGDSATMATMAAQLKKGGLTKALKKFF
ncbi:MAG: SDR family oxidoreductase [Pseudomonadota bacterium]|nr:SDR family oxidoreductase [Pseudomonadota bacterium]